jgi:CHAT domain
MAEISLILTSPGSKSPATSIALADTGAGIAAITYESLISLRAGRDAIEQMMRGAPRMTSIQLQRFGKSMGEALFQADVGATWSNAAAQADLDAKKESPLITKLLVTSQELKEIPWEYAAWPGGKDGPRLLNSVVRLVPQTKVTPATPISKRLGLRILLLRASPLGMEAIPWADIRDTLLAVFSDKKSGLEVVSDAQKPNGTSYIRIVEAANRDAVEKWVIADNPHVIHFVGHGTQNGLALVDSKSARATIMSALAFGTAIQRAQSLRLVILSACDTANYVGIDPVDATIGVFAEQIVRNGVPAAIASQMVIEKGTIALFCQEVYRELLSRGSIDMAVASGRCKVAQELDQPDSAAIEWGIPVLYRRLGAAQIFA